MTRYYTYSDLQYGENIENQAIDATEASDTLELERPSKKILARNTGTNDVYLAFDKNKATEDDFLLTADDGLVEIPAQCEKVSAICAAGETAGVRITSCY